MTGRTLKSSLIRGTPAKGNPEPSPAISREGVETNRRPQVGSKREPSNKNCRECKTDKPPSEFYWKSKKDSRKDTLCKRCRIIQLRESKLGITDGDYWRLYHQQNGVCGVCRSRLRSKRYKRFCVDHDHSTGEIRGLLCMNCNTALGLLKDDPECMERAIQWMKS